MDDKPRSTVGRDAEVPKKVTESIGTKRNGKGERGKGKGKNGPENGGGGGGYPSLSPFPFPRFLTLWEIRKLLR